MCEHGLTISRPTATLKLAPKLPYTVAVSSFPTIQAAADAAKDLVVGGVGLACIELLDDVMVKAINKKGGGITWEEKPRCDLASLA